jgi:hypothetical protein
MKPEELKINNWVFTQKESKRVACQIKSIDISDNGIYSVKVYLKNAKVWLIKNIDEIIPVPLSEKGLDTLGFKFRANGYYILSRMRIKWYVEVKSDISIWIDDVMLPYSITKNVRYTHQLQNLYFGSTQSELDRLKVKVKNPELNSSKPDLFNQEELTLSNGQATQVELNQKK